MPFCFIDLYLSRYIQQGCIYLVDRDCLKLLGYITITFIVYVNNGQRSDDYCLIWLVEMIISGIKKPARRLVFNF